MKQYESFSVPVNPPFSFKECLWFLNRDFDDCMHTIEGNSVIKAVYIEGKPCLFSVTDGNDGLYVAVLAGGKSYKVRVAILNYVIEWFDLKRDIDPFYNLLQKNKSVAYMAEAFNGLRLVGITSLFEALCWGIIGQQINLSFAYRLKRRMVERYGKSVSFEGKKYWLFPEPEILAKADINDLREMQFSQKKAEYIIGLANVFHEGTMSRSVLENLITFDARQQALIAIRGIGIWTANYALMKSMRMDEAVPYGDVGLLQALVRHNLIRDRKDLASIDSLFHKFKGWEIYLVFYLWRSLVQPSEDSQTAL